MNENEKRGVEEIILWELEKIVIDILSTKEWVATVKKIVAAAACISLFYWLIEKQNLTEKK